MCAACDGEIEILRSRMVVGQAAENLNLAISTDPALQIARFQPPLSLEGQGLHRLRDGGGYRLTGPDGKALGNGRWERCSNSPTPMKQASFWPCRPAQRPEKILS